MFSNFIFACIMAYSGSMVVDLSRVVPVVNSTAVRSTRFESGLFLLGRRCAFPADGHPLRAAWISVNAWRIYPILVAGIGTFCALLAWSSCNLLLSPNLYAHTTALHPRWVDAEAACDRCPDSLTLA
jgi:hypothetical protein